MADARFMDNYPHHKKGKQYSHYCGADLQEILDCAWMAGETLTEDIEGAKTWLNKVKAQISILRDKIAALDQLNGMTY